MTDTVRIDSARIWTLEKLHRIYAHMSDARIPESARDIVRAIDRRMWLALALAVIGGVMMGRATAPRNSHST